MSEDTDEEADPAVELGAQASVDGAPIARIAARFVWGVERSEVVEREGQTQIRTPDGPRALADILEDVDETYFSTRQDFVTAVETAVGPGPVPTAEE